MAIDWNALFKEGTAAVKAEARRSLSAKGQNAHIEPQNDAVRNFETLALTPYRLGQISQAQAIDMIGQISRGFAIYAQELGYSRAYQGSSEVTALGAQLIRDLNGSSPHVPVPYVPPAGGPYLPTLPGGMSWTTVALIGGAALLLLRKKVF